jgi:hypothetical protein
MRHLGRHAYALAQRGVRVYGFADVHRVGAHLYGQRRWTNQELLLPGQVADLALIAALYSEEGDQADWELAEGCYHGAH